MIVAELIAQTWAYFTPCINRTVGLIRIASTTAAAMLKTATEPNRVGRGIELYMEGALPASQLPILGERNQNPHEERGGRGGGEFGLAPHPPGPRPNRPRRRRRGGAGEPVGRDLRAAH